MTTVYIANVVKCRPPGNRDPLPLEIESCRPYLEAQVEFIDPKVVVTLGNFATKLLLDTKEGITKLRGQEFPYRDGGCWSRRCTRRRCCATAAPRSRRRRADFVRRQARARHARVTVTPTVAPRSAGETGLLAAARRRAAPCGRRGRARG